MSSGALTFDLAAVERALAMRSPTLELALATASYLLAVPIWIEKFNHLEI